MRSPPAEPPGVVPVIVVLPAAVRRPAASTVNVATCVAEPYDAAATPVVDILPDVIALSATSAVAIVPSAILPDVTASSASFVVVIAAAATVGFGYVPVRSPPAVPPGAAPLIVTLPAAVRRPAASTVNVPTCVVEPYDPAATPVVDIFAVVTALLAISAVAMVPSAIFVDVIADVATVGFGYVPVRSPPATPPGVVPVMSTLPAYWSRPF